MGEGEPIVVWQKEAWAPALRETGAGHL